jgi:hypothetical protein
MSTAGRTSVCLSLVLGLALGFGLPACSGDDGAGDDGGEDDALAAGNVAAALDSGSELSRLVVPLEASPDLGGQGPDVARALKVANAIAAFRGLASNPLCVRVTTDNTTFLDVTFDRCRIGLLFTLDGSLHAGVAIESAGGLPSRLAVSVAIPSLVLTGPVHSRRLSGAFELRHAILPQGAPVELEGDLRFATETGGEVALALGAEWTVANNCVTFTGGAQLSGDLLGPVGPIALSGEDVRGCRNQCPTAGSVELSYGHGKLLTWTYTGESTVTVSGPRGRRVEVPLACGDS